MPCGPDGIKGQSGRTVESDVRAFCAAALYCASCAYDRQALQWQQRPDSRGGGADSLTSTQSPRRFKAAASGAYRPSPRGPGASGQWPSARRSAPAASRSTSSSRSMDAASLQIGVIVRHFEVVLCVGCTALTLVKHMDTENTENRCKFHNGFENDEKCCKPLTRQDVAPTTQNLLDVRHRVGELQCHQFSIDCYATGPFRSMVCDRGTIASTDREPRYVDTSKAPSTHDLVHFVAGAPSQLSLEGTLKGGGIVRRSWLVLALRVVHPNVIESSLAIQRRHKGLMMHVRRGSRPFLTHR